MSTRFGTAVTVVAVTVTYGRRRQMLEQVLCALLAENVGMIVVVSNGAPWDVAALARRLAPERIDVVLLPENGGSAIGFAAGIQRACDLGAELIWLLDDDTQPEVTSLQSLLAAYNELGVRIPKSKLAVAACRSNHLFHLAAGIPLPRSDIRRSSFCGFYLLGIPGKLWRRIPWLPRFKRQLPSMVPLDTTGYGGLLIHRSVVSTYGLPRTDFVQYTDDLDFTYRITRNGGRIYLVTTARLQDLEASWGGSARASNSFKGWLLNGSDASVYYAARNDTYVDSHLFCQSKFEFLLNRMAFNVALWMYARLLRRTARYEMLRCAMRDGLDGRLGLNLRYPL